MGKGQLTDFDLKILAGALGTADLREESVGNPDFDKRSASLTIRWTGPNSLMLKNHVSDLLRKAGAGGAS